MLKEAALLIPPIKRLHQHNEELRRQNEFLAQHNELLSLEIDAIKSQYEQATSDSNSLQAQYEHMKSTYEMQHGADTYRFEHLNEMFEDNVEHSWSQEESRKKFTCLQPFTRIDINMGGNVCTCCTTHLKHDYIVIGNAYNNSFDEMNPHYDAVEILTRLRKEAGITVSDNCMGEE